MELKESSPSQTAVEETRPKPAGPERRSATRHRFTYRQFVAPWVTEGLPPPTAYTVVLCHDVSRTGFSFLADEPYDCERVVAALGPPHKLTYVVAKVVRCSPQQTKTGKKFVVGCQICGRIEAVWKGAEHSSAQGQ